MYRCSEMLQDGKCSEEEGEEEGEEDWATNKMALCVCPHDPLTLCAPCVNSDLWIISFEDEMTKNKKKQRFSPAFFTFGETYLCIFKKHLRVGPQPYLTEPDMGRLLNDCLVS